jgi:hypothetical protein
MRTCNIPLRISRVNSKAEFFQLSQRLLLGNRLRQWTWTEYNQISIAELPALTSVRSRNLTASKLIQRYRMTPVQTKRHVTKLLACGFAESDFFLDESAPDHLVTIQGEVMNSKKFLYLRYNTVPGLGMRQAYPIMKHAEGLRALTLLQYYLDARSWDCMQEILTLYRDSIIEFSAYSVSLGVLGWHSVIWEVRNY